MPIAMLAAGFPLRSLPPSKLGLPVGSTGVLCLPATLGDMLCELGEITGSVQVPVEPQPAGLTGEDALGQGELDYHPSAGRTHLGRGIEPVSHHQPTTVPSRLVAELSA